MINLILVLLMIGQCGKKKSTEPTPPETTGTISGTIRNAEDQSPIDSAWVEAQPGDYFIQSDSIGFYRLTELSEGQYTLIASKEKFYADTSDVVVTVGQTTNADFNLIPEFDVLKWKFLTDKPIYYATPAVDNEGTIYVGTGVYIGTISGSLYAIYPDGTLKWKYDFINNANSPVIGEDGTIYIMDRMNVLYAFNPSGSIKWQYDDWIEDDFPEVGQRCVAIGYDQTLYIYVGLDLYAINPDGTRQWVFDAGPGGTECGASPGIGSDGTIYAILGKEILHAVNPDGSLKWEFYLENWDEHSYTSLALDADDVIYFGTENRYGGYVYAVYPSGTLKWRIFAGSERPVRASPVIDVDGTVYTATKAYSHRRPAEVLAISPQGFITWRYALESVHFTPDDAYATPAIGADGLIYAAAETGFVYALNRDGTLAWKQDLYCGLNWSSPTIIDDGTLYIGTMTNEGGALCALQTQSMGYADSPWPTFRQNNMNNARYNGQ